MLSLFVDQKSILLDQTGSIRLLPLQSGGCNLLTKILYPLLNSKNIYPDKINYK